MIRLALTSLVLASSCAVDLKVPQEAGLSCAVDRDCPGGSTCRQNVGRCVSADIGDHSPPVLLTSAVQPPSGTIGTSFTVSVTLDEATVEPPTLTVDPEGLGRDLLADETTGLTFHYHYAADGSEPAAAALLLRAADVWGNEAFLPAGALDIDTTPPALEGPSWVDPPAGEATAAQVLTLTAVSEAGASPVSVTLYDQSGGIRAATVLLAASSEDAGGATVVRVTGRLALSDVDLGGVDSLTAELTVRDAAGNVASGRTAAQPVDDAPPDTRFDQTPAAVSTTMRLDFVVASPDSDVVGFECSLDGAPFTDCAPLLGTPLADDGAHSFLARAVDDAGLVDPTPVRYDWTEQRFFASTPGALSATATGACAVASDGTLWCWGENYYAQLGLGYTSLPVPRPARVGDANDWISVVASPGFACGIRDAGGNHDLYCWGSGSTGQLADGVAGDRPRPTSTGTSGWSSLTLSPQSTPASGYACGVKSGGTLWCWGNGQEAMGLGGTASVLVPTQVGTDADWAQVSASLTHTCGRRGGTLWCWGVDVAGQAGDPGLSTFATPRQVGSASDWVDVIAWGAHSCGLRDDGAGNRTLWCWGTSAGGPVFTPTLADAATDWQQLTRSSQNACGERSDHAWYCWGIGQYGEPSLGANDLAWSTVTPQRLGTTETFVTLATGGSHICGVDAASALWCWGSDLYGQLGDGGAVQPNAVTVAGGLVASQIASVMGTTCAVSAGTLVCWGSNGYGALRGTTETAVDAPRSADAATDWTAVRVQWPGAAQTAVLLGLRGGVLYGLDNGAANFTQRDPATDWTSLSASGPMYAGALCGLKANSGAPTLWCWGNDDRGQLGLGAVAAQTSPQQVGAGQSYETGWLAVANGTQHTCGIRDDGAGNRALWCWGGSANGRLGLGDGASSTNVPVEVGGSDWQALAAGDRHTCGLRSGGALWCWGAGANGRLGLGDDADVSSPTLVSSTAFTTLAAGDDHSCAVAAADGSVWCWGKNTGGQVGGVPLGNVRTPRQVPGVSGATSVAAGSDHTCVTTVASVLCWGNDLSGQLGDGAAFGPAILAAP